MLKLEIGREVVIEENRKVRFGFEVEHVLLLEHSLAALFKWERIWEKPFIDDSSKSAAEIISYIECMIQTPEYPEEALQKLTQKNLNEVDAYINAKMTATWFNEEQLQKRASTTEKLTAELIYFWLSGIPSPPPDYQHWHLNNLFTYIKIHDVKNQKPTQKSGREMVADRRARNEANKARLGTTG